MVVAGCIVVLPSTVGGESIFFRKFFSGKKGFFMSAPNFNSMNNNRPLRSGGNSQAWGIAAVGVLAVGAYLYWSKRGKEKMSQRDFRGTNYPTRIDTPENGPATASTAAHGPAAGTVVARH